MGAGGGGRGGGPQPRGGGGGGGCGGGDLVPVGVVYVFWLVGFAFGIDGWGGGGAVL